MKRTGSMASRVPPAETRIRTPARSPAAGRPVPSMPSTAATMVAGSAMRPDPTSPPASLPSSGGITVTPRA